MRSIEFPSELRSAMKPASSGARAVPTFSMKLWMAFVVARISGSVTS